MAVRYWVGGTGNWDNSDTTHWSATTGGAGGSSVNDSMGISDSTFSELFPPSKRRISKTTRRNTASLTGKDITTLKTKKL